MESIKHSSAVDSEVFVTGIVDDARYLIMRVIRLVVLILCEIGIVFAGLGALRAALAWALTEPGGSIVSTSGVAWLDFVGNNPVPGFWIASIGFVLLWMLIYAVGLPYRYETKKPGLNARRCHKCRIAVPDDAFCSNCNVFRPAKIASLVLYGLSAVVTGVFIIHDLALLLVIMFMAGGKK